MPRFRIGNFGMKFSFRWIIGPEILCFHKFERAKSFKFVYLANTYVTEAVCVRIMVALRGEVETLRRSCCV